MHTVMGLDLSLTRTGYAVLELETGLLLCRGAVSAPKKGEMRDRMGVIVERIGSIHRSYQPSDVFVERPFARHARTTGILWRLYGEVVRGALEREPGEVSTTAVKSIAPDFGQSSKLGVCAAAQERWGIEFEVDDMADAAWVAEYGRLAFLAAMASAN
jgi:Holliday junction resolvasome RuvABC endonuclease subunit